MRDTHGGNIYDYGKIAYDFSSNVNPLGMPEGAAEVIERHARQFFRHPDIEGRSLRQQIALHDEVAFPHIVLGGGVSELVYALCNAMRPERCLVLAPTFSEYEVAMKLFGCKLSRMNLREEEDFKLARQEMSDLFAWIRKTAGKRMIFFCNPNNPTGVMVQKQHLLRIADICEQEGVYLCVDESFIPFLKDEGFYTLKTEVHAYNHLIVLRSFNEFYGMAGLGLSYALTSNEELLKEFKRVLPPWNTSLAAQMAGEKALQDKKYETETVSLIETEREYLINELKNGLVDKVFLTDSNFILFKAEKNLLPKLIRYGILIRDCSDYVNLGEGFYRVAVRNHNDNMVLIAALKKRMEK